MSIELLHGNRLEEFRQSVDARKASEGKHNWNWAKSFLDLPFESKIHIAQTRIIEWVQYYEGKVYVSFSGGKDSTVLLDLVRRVYPECPAVFCDTGLEYPEIRDFVKTIDNVKWIYPIKWNRNTRQYDRVSFRWILDNCGYPLPTKEIAETVRRAKHNPNDTAAWSKLNGTLIDKNTGKKSRFNCAKWKYLLNAPFNVSGECCKFMKKKPFHKYEMETGRKPIIGTLSSESVIRKSNWLQRGCNSFNEKSPRSNPLSAWYDTDILRYIKEFGLKYASVYGDIVKKANGEYITTRESRTGCMFCMFGVHLEPEPNRFQRMAQSHPDCYNYCINKLGLSVPLNYIGVPYRPYAQISLFDNMDACINTNND